MSFSTNVLSTIAECDAVLTVATKEKRGLQYKKSSLDKQKESFSESSTTVDQDLTEIDAKVLALQTIVATLPEGDLKEENKIKLKSAEARQMALSRRDKNYTTVALLSLELDLERVQKESDAIDQFIADINSKKATL